MWFTYDLDVKNYDQADPLSKERALYYEFLVAQTKLIEHKLKNSKIYKGKGLNNYDIKLIQEKGISAEKYINEQRLENFIGLTFGDLSQEVYDLQQKLNSLGYELPVDGNFRSSTRDTLKRFQEENNLAPTGFVDKRTAAKLFGNF